MSENDNDDKTITLSDLEFRIGTVLAMIGIFSAGFAVLHLNEVFLKRTFNEVSYLQEQKKMREVTGRCNEQASAETNLKSYERKFSDCYKKDFPPRPMGMMH